MILNKLSTINSLKIVLASKSPRRRQILDQIGLHFEVIVSDFEEDLDKTAYTPENYVLLNSKNKASSVLRMLREKNQSIPDIIIGCDTVVVFQNKIIGKPKDEEDAFNTLKSFSGQSHEVMSGVTILYKNQEEMKEISFCDKTKVMFDELSDELIRSYIATKEPMDKAGGYGIQGIAGCLIRGIEGCYYNVMGFPLNHFCRELNKLY